MKQEKYKDIENVLEDEEIIVNDVEVCENINYLDRIKKIIEISEREHRNYDYKCFYSNTISDIRRYACYADINHYNDELFLFLEKSQYSTQIKEDEYYIIEDFLEILNSLSDNKFTIQSYFEEGLDNNFYYFKVKFENITENKYATKLYFLTWFRMLFENEYREDFYKFMSLIYLYKHHKKPIKNYLRLLFISVLQFDSKNLKYAEDYTKNSGHSLFCDPGFPPTDDECIKKLKHTNVQNSTKGKSMNLNHNYEDCEIDIFYIIKNKLEKEYFKKIEEIEKNYG